MKKKIGDSGFTLIELLAVIVIMAILMLVAIPAVSRVIENSKKSTYIDTAKQYVSSLGNMVTSGEFEMDDYDTTYYVPVSCIPLDRGGDSPFGKFEEAYVAVWPRSDGTYSYYWTSRDTAGMGVKDLTYFEDLKRGMITANVDSLKTDVSIGSTTKIKVLDYDCNVYTAMDATPETITKSFSEDDWGTIARAIKLGKTENYHVGDTKTINMGDYGTHKVRISNLSNKECVGVASETTCGFVAEFVDVIDIQQFNPAGTLYGVNYPEGYSVGGWPASSIRKRVNTDIYNALPRELQEVIIDTKVVSGHGKTDGKGNLVNDNFVSYDKLFLLSVNEVYGPGFTSDATSVRGIDRQLDWYRDIGKVTRTKTDGAIKKGSTWQWYLRTPNVSQDYLCYYVLASGLWYNDPCYYSRGISPAFRIG